MDKENLALTDIGELTNFVILHVTASCEPAVPEGRPAGCPVENNILSSEETESKITEEAETVFVGELT
jgi:hypothetical protein